MKALLETISKPKWVLGLVLLLAPLHLIADETPVRPGQASEGEYDQAFPRSNTPGAMTEDQNENTGTETAPVSQGPSREDLTFLALPAFDAEALINPGKKPLVGDQLRIIVKGISLPGVTNSQTELKPGSPRSVSVTGAAPGGASGKKPPEDEWGVFPEPEPSGVTKPGELVFRAIPLKGGKLTLPSVPLLDSTGKAVGRTNPLSLEVQSAIAPDDPKPQEVVDVRPPVRVGFPWSIIVVAAILLMAVTATAVYFAMKMAGRKKNSPLPTGPIEPPRPEDEVAIEAIAQLEKEGLHRKGQVKKHYFRISDVLKTYAGDRYRFDALESTSREMITVLEIEKGLSSESLRLVERIFTKLDFVKFTDHVPTPEEGDELLQWAREFVAATRRPKVAPTVMSGSKLEGAPRAV